MPLNISFRQLQALSAIARTGKIVSAAKVLGLTPPAVTLQLKQIETEIGLSLFDRTPGGMRPTAAGLAAIEAARSIDERLRVLADQVDAIKGIKRGSLRLGVVSTAKYFAPQIMAAFMREYADIDMVLTVGNRALVIAALSDHTIDIALMGRPPKEVPVRAAVIGEHPLVIVAAPDHPLANETGISKERIAEETFLVREAGSGTRISLEVFFAEIPSKLDNIGTEMGSNETIKQAVMAGLGVGFISAHTVAAEIADGRLVALDVEGLPVRRQWFSVSRSDRSMTPAMEVFSLFLTTQGADFLPVLAPPARSGGDGPGPGTG